MVEYELFFSCVFVWACVWIGSATETFKNDLKDQDDDSIVLNVGITMCVFGNRSTIDVNIPRY